MPGANGIVPGAEPISLEGNSGRAVLMLHGFGDTPQTLRYIAEAMHAEGYTVRAPLLPGHGRTLAAFGATRAKQWIAAARQAYEELTATHGPSPIVGLSMGGALAIILAAETPAMPALALVAPYVSMPRRARIVARFHSLWQLVTPYFRSGGERSIHDESERAKNRGYGVLTPGLLFELSRVVRRVQVSLPRVQAPTLVIHGLNDERIPPDAAAREYARLGAADKRLVWLDQGGHVLTVDYGRDRVIGLVGDWLARHPARAPGADASRRAMP
ncbi:MAG TPA: alpha/beta fold hydrolase [Gemmatimonadaceae bacterium]